MKANTVHPSPEVAKEPCIEQLAPPSPAASGEDSAETARVTPPLPLASPPQQLTLDKQPDSPAPVQKELLLVSAEESSKGKWLKPTIVAVVVLALIVSGVTVLQTPIISFIRWIRTQNASGAVLFVTVMATAIVCCIPSSVFELSSGCIYGEGSLLLAVVVTTCGKMSGGCVSFAIGRFGGQSFVRTHILGSKASLMRGFNRAMRLHHHKFMFLMQTAYLPVFVKNYGLALLDSGVVTFISFFSWTFFVGIPYSTLHAFIANEICETLLDTVNETEVGLIGTPDYSGGGGTNNTTDGGGSKAKGGVSAGKIAILAVGIVSSFGTVAFIGWYTNMSIQEILAEDRARLGATKSQKIVLLTTPRLHSNGAVAVLESEGTGTPAKRAPPPAADAGAGATTATRLAF